MSRRPGQWVDELVAAVGCGYVRIETKDGSRREGKITAIQTRTLIVNGHPEEIPTDIELNGDPIDSIAIDWIQKMELDVPSAKRKE